MFQSPAELKAEILRLTRDYSEAMHQANLPAAESSLPFQEGVTTIPYAGRVFNADEVEAAVGSTLDFWLTLGPEGDAFEKELAGFLGVKSSLLVNSGSSANLIALSALTSPRLPSAQRIRPGDEVLTVAAGFPTTVAPIIQVGAVAVFLDNDPSTGNLRAQRSLLEAAFSPGKTKAVMMAHGLGNPFDIAVVLEFCRRHELWLIEDNCDALGSTYSLPVQQAKTLGLDHLLNLAEVNASPVKGRASGSGVSTAKKIPFIEERILTAYTGSFGDLSTQSFYPPHHLTMGEGGAINVISRPALKTYVESFRDWGRDCWCASGHDNTCKKRFGWQLGELPEGYDHKYIYSHLGYNMKPLDTQAAIGRQQLKKLPDFIIARKQNWEYLRRGLADLEELFEFTLPTHAIRWVPPSKEEAQSLGSRGKPPQAATPPAATLTSSFEWDESGCRTDCSWFGFMLRVKASAPFSHADLARHLDEKKIGNRMFFGGNLLRQPVFVQLRQDNPKAFRVVDRDGMTVQPLNESTIGAALPGADAIMHAALFLGTYPGLTKAMLDYEIATIREFVSAR